MRRPVESAYTVEDLAGNPILNPNGHPVIQVNLDANGLANFEVKTGNACLTSNQRCVYNMQVSGDEVVSVGKNADRLFVDGSAPSAVYVIRKN